MAPTYRSGSAQTGTGTAVSSVAITKPIGLAVGDVIDLEIELNVGTGSPVSMPAGWTREINVASIAANTSHVERWWKIADAADVAAASYTCTFGANRTYAYNVIAIVGTDPITPVNVSASGTEASGTAHTCPSVTTTQNNTLVVCGIGAPDTTTFSSTDLTNISQATRTNAASMLGITTQAVAGATGTKAVTLGTARNAGVTTVAYNGPLPVVFAVPLITRTPQVLTPGLIRGARDFAVPLTTRTPTVFTPTIKSVMTLDVPRISRTPVVYEFGTKITADVIAQEKQIIRSTLEGYAGPIKTRNRLLISDKFGNELTELDDWDNASVSMSNFTDATWELNFTARYTDAFDPETDYITAVTDVWIDGEWERFYMGQYRFLGQSNTYLEQLRTWALTGHSVEDILFNDQPVTGYTVAAGAMCLVTVKALLVSLGFPASRIDFPTTDHAIPNGLYWHPAESEEDVNWLRVINSMLNSCGFSSLRTDSYGRLYAFDIPEDPTKMAPDVIYGPADMPDTENFVGEEVTDDWDYERFANRIVAVSSDVNQVPPIVAVAENRNPNSRASIQRLGRTITKKVSTSTAASQATLDRMAKAQLITASGYYRRGTIKTLRDPRRKPDETYEFIYVSEGQQVMSDRWNVIKWEYPLDREMSAMTHEISKVESV